jgi:ubiquinone/menaquinone biosynthesis C-methylase UbiE
MNLGYVATDAPQYSPVRLPEHMLGRKYIKLVLEVFGDCDLNGRRLLDVGCGRGGTIRTALTYCKPSLAIGVDLTTGGIELARRSLRFPNTWFLRGNAEHLPFADAAFDVVTNIESSHHYSNVDSFYRNVWRVLAPGGHFLYTTFLPVPQFEHDLVTLAELGFQLKRELDITPNVLAACDQDRGGVFSGFASGEENPWIANAVSMPGSDTYNYMSSGRALYKLFKFVKPA